MGARNFTSGIFLNCEMCNGTVPTPMRVVAVLICALMLFAAPASQGQGASVTLRRYQIFNRQYVSLDDWSRAYSFKRRWIFRNKTIELSNDKTRLAFTGDSAEVLVNGVKVWLSYPVVASGGTLYITYLD